MSNQKLDIESLLESEYLRDFDEPEMALAAAQIWGLTLEETQEMEETTGNYGYGKTYTHLFLSFKFFLSHQA